MKKILFVACAIVAMTFASCGRCNGNGQHADQDTLEVFDTTVVETVDTVYAE